MAYNGGYFPASYQYYPQAQPQAQTGGNSIIWVQGEAGAKSYLVAPNTTVQLWDSENQTIYLKSADASGMPSIKTLDYTVRSEAAGSPQGLLSDGRVCDVSRKDLDALQEQIDTIRGELMAWKHKEADKNE